MEKKRVAIVGAGISGLVACKHAASRGFEPIVFEAEHRIGGLWNHTIESTRLQVSRQVYQFSDFPWPSSADAFPHSAQIVEYLQAYALKFDLFPYIKFNSKVMSIDYVGEREGEEMQSCADGSGNAFGSKGKWLLKVFEDSVKEYEADFVVLCIGRFSGLPNIPECGPEIFSGKVLHSMDYSAMENEDAANFIKGKRVAIIGSAKSATDIAFECANANGKDKPCTMIQRSVHWGLPNYHPLGVEFTKLFFIRFSELIFHKPRESVLANMLATLLTPLGWIMFKVMEIYLRWKLPLKKHGMIPEESFLRDAASSCTAFVLPDENFYDKVEDGSIVLKKSHQFRFCKEGLIIDGDHTNPVEADIVIFATGYRGDDKLKNIFASPTFQNYIAGSPASILPLYRQMIHPRIPQLAVIGYSESFSNLYTSEIRSIWLAHLLDETFKLPSVKAMEEEIESWENHLKRYAGDGGFRRACIASVQIWYNDQLCKDIGCNPRRKKGFFSEWFEPYLSVDYKDLAPN